MSDPRMTDPRYSDQGPRDPMLAREQTNRSLWGWIAGIVVLALIVFAVIAGNNSADKNTASNPTPPSTTGSGTTSPQPAPTPAPGQSGTR